MMVLYEYDTEPFKNHTTKEFVRSKNMLIQYLLDRGLKPIALCIKTECPEAL